MLQQMKAIQKIIVIIIMKMNTAMNDSDINNKKEDKNISNIN